MENYTALIASFDGEGKLDKPGLLEILRYNGEMSKTDGLFVNGTGGESYILDLDTKKEIFETVKENAHDVKLIAQIGCNNFREVVELGKYVKELGYDAVSILTPQYLATSYAEVKAYFAYMTERIELPIYVYYFPSLNQITLNLEQFGGILEMQNIAGIKFTATDLKLAERLKRYYPHMKMYIGYDEFVATASLLGLDGAVGVSFNILGKPICTMRQYVCQNDFVRAQRVQQDINDFLEQFRSGMMYQTMRMLMKHYGYACGYSRLPLTKEVPFDASLVQAYEKLLKKEY